jgi:hypothetical protein
LIGAQFALSMPTRTDSSIHQHESTITVHAHRDVIPCSPYGPPTAIGGSASAKKVAVGGKLGVVQDPFGKRGQPKFLGATLPLDGYGIMNLSLSEPDPKRPNGQVLIGQLYGSWSANIFDNSPRPHQNHVWNVQDLITKALANERPMSKHIRLETNSEQLIPITTNTSGYSYTAAPAGTAFDPDSIALAYTGNLGDIIEVDLRDLAARKLLNIPGKDSLAWKNKTPAQKTADEALIRTKANALQGFTFDLTDWGQYTDPTRIAQTPEGMQLVTQSTNGGKRPDIISRNANGEPTTSPVDFERSPVFYLAPNINDIEVGLLRAGMRLTVDKQAFFSFNYQEKDAQGKLESKKGSILVTAKDYAGSGTEVFFGDRPLDNPGYSTMTLSGAVGVGQANNRLDVFKVEQRLKYLGFPAIQLGTGNTIKDFSVDGKFAAQETAALKLFEKVVRYQNAGGDARFANNNNGADGVLESPSANNAQGLRTLNWLNAYNTPHWMQYFAGTGATGATDPKFQSRNANLPGWQNMQFGTREGNVELFGTSWMRDLMVAKQFAPSQMVKGSSWFNGTTDANHQYTPTGHATHDLGMAMDLGISNYIDATNQLRDGENVPAIVITQPNPTWSEQRAIELAALLNAEPTGPSPTRLRANNQRAATQDFLSLYWATKEDIKRRDAQGAQTQQWVIQNGTTDAEKRHIQNLLFRGTNQAGNADASISSIRGIFIGADQSRLVRGGPLVDANRYQRINEVLVALGIANSNSQDHQNHFHFSLTPPAPEPIAAARNLLADSFDDSPSLWAVVQASSLLYQDLDQDIGADQLLAQAQLPNADRVVKVCRAFEDGARVAPDEDAKRLYVKWNGRSPQDPSWQKEWNALSVLSVSMVEKPTHGTFEMQGNDPAGSNDYTYIPPSPEFNGKDRWSFLVKLSNGKSVLMRYQMEPGIMDRSFYEQKCVFTTRLGQMHLSPTELDAANADYAAWQRASDLSALLANANQSLVGFTDLPSTAIGETAGQGLNASITLDKDAAGHTWYIDPSPLNNADDYLPTSNPNVWQAKADSAAAGKMDMLSVLLHEYGHALGLEHSAHGADFMAASLQPGMRKLPSADELSLMSQLIAQLRQQQEALSPTLSQGEGEPDPFNPFGPGAPLSLLGLLPIGFIRRNAASGTAAAALGTSTATHT